MRSDSVRARKWGAGLLTAMAVSVALVAASCGGGDVTPGGGGAATTASGAGGSADGAAVYTANCASCHGANGEGGTGPAMTTVKTVFPAEADHIEWVKEKAAGTSGPYGANNSGNAGKGSTPGAMPKFGDTLSEDQIKAVVEYERTDLAK